MIRSTAGWPGWTAGKRPTLGRSAMVSTAGASQERPIIARLPRGGWRAHGPPRAASSPLLLMPTSVHSCAGRPVQVNPAATPDGRQSSKTRQRSPRRVGETESLRRVVSRAPSVGTTEHFGKTADRLPLGRRTARPAAGRSPTGSAATGRCRRSPPARPGRGTRGTSRPRPPARPGSRCRPLPAPPRHRRSGCRCAAPALSRRRAGH